MNSFPAIASTLLGACLCFTSPASATEYLFYRLDSLGGTFTLPTGINNAGEIAGNAYTADNLYTHAVRWSGTRITDLGTTGSSSTAETINEAGDIGGALDVNGRSHAGIWRGTAFTDLHPAGADVSRITGLNDRGQAVGTSSNPDFSVDSLVWNGRTSTKLTQPAGGTAYPAAINDAGQIVGSGFDPTHSFSAVRWDHGKFEFLTSLPGGTSSQAWAINQAGQIAGTSGGSDPYFSHPVLWNGTQVIDLDPAAHFSNASALNNVGQTVGVSDSFPDTFGDPGPVIWDGTAMTAITGAVPRGFYPRDINDNGLIVGNSVSMNHVIDAWLAVPVPEPEAIAMLLAGLAVVTAAGRLRRRGVAVPGDPAARPMSQVETQNPGEK